MTLHSVVLRPPLLLLTIAACGPRAPDRLTQGDQAALRSLIARLPQLVRAGNPDSLAALYTEDGFKMPPNQAVVQGRTAIRQWFAQLPPITNFDFRISYLDGRADLAVLRGSYTITYTPAGGRAVSDSGKELVVFRKQADGSWLRLGDIWSSDLPPRK